MSSSHPQIPPPATEENNTTNNTPDEPHRVLALYKFVSPPLENLKDLQHELETKCREHHARGTLLIANEGINGTICYPLSYANDKSQSDPLLDFLQSKVDGGLRIRISKANRSVFTRLKIKIKSEIVTLHQDHCHPTESKGDYIPPQEWNALLEDPDCLVVDTRNEYEVRLGTFRNAVNPHTQSFVEFPEWMEHHVAGDKAPKKIAMFCTGGIRCEKATNACQKLVPKDVQVYHLEGGILAYLDAISPQDSLFDGECYVFDQRVAVTHGNQPSTRYTTSCRACRHPLSKEDVKRDDFTLGQSCRWCVGKLTEKQKERFEQRQRQVELAEKMGICHIYDPKEFKTKMARKARPP